MASADGEFTPPKTSGLLPAWRAGQSGNPAGRPQGSRQRLTEKFLDDIHEDWLVHGVEAIQVVRERDPSTYLRIVASLVPKQSAHLRANVSTNRSLDAINADLVDAVRAIGFVVTPLESLAKAAETKIGD